jgi:hypothetical protein
MKNFSLIISTLALGVILALSGCSSAGAKAPEAAAKKTPGQLVPIEKMGFFTVSKCAASGEFKDCYLENYACGSDGCFKNINPGEEKNVPLAIFVQTEGKIYNADVSKIEKSELDENINRNDVTLIGSYNEDTNTIIATEIKGPPPPAKSFFKGCL